MISDVLAEANAAIDRYMTNPTYTRCYGGDAGAIKKVQQVMDSLRVLYDTPPWPERDGALDELRDAIERLDLSNVIAASEKLAGVIHNHSGPAL